MIVLITVSVVVPAWAGVILKAGVNLYMTKGSPRVGGGDPASIVHVARKIA